MIDNFFVSKNFKKKTANCQHVKVVRSCFQVHLINLSPTFIGFDVLKNVVLIPTGVRFYRTTGGS